jgi:hypothetical protein
MKLSAGLSLKLQRPYLLGTADKDMEQQTRTAWDKGCSKYKNKIDILLHTMLLSKYLSIEYVSIDYYEEKRLNFFECFIIIYYYFVTKRCNV